jgi:hypothetical protein
MKRQHIFYGEALLAPCPTPKLMDRPVSAVRDCLFDIFAATLHTWRATPPYLKDYDLNIYYSEPDLLLLGRE